MEKPINLLFIDDEQPILNAVTRKFISEPFAVKTTTEPEEVLSIIEREDIKVIVSDHRMPKMEGVELLKKVREKRPDIIRILLTGYADLKAIEDAINDAGVYRYLNKPWDDYELKSVILQAIEHFDLLREKRKADEQIYTLYEKQKEFTSVVSHELRTPLAAIKSSIDIINSGTPGPLSDDQNKFLGKAKSNVDRLSRLINDILDLTKLEAGKLELKTEECDLNALIKSVIEMQEDAAKNRDISLKVECADLATLSVDADRIIQVLTNLINNALKFTTQGEVVVLAKMHDYPSFVEVEVRDTGCGIGQEDLNKVFDKFQQIEDPSRNQMGGTGLGLPICQEIVKRHGGKIWVESILGEGSSFKFTLPVKTHH